jgi:glycosyltransferase involved in cell wall biosynthesis
VTDQLPMRVLWLIRGLGPGGAERLLVAHARAAGEGFAYEAAYQVAAKDQLVPELEEAGVVVHRLGSGPTWPLELRRLVRDRGIDVVHSHSPAMAVGARLALRALPMRGRPRSVYTEHNRWQAYHLATRAANALTFVLEDDVLAVSEEARSSVWGPLRGRVETLHHGIDRAALRRSAAPRAAVRAALDLGADVPVAVQVANFRREKAHEVLLDAARLLADREHPVQFLLVGQGPLEQQVRARAEQLDLGATVRFLGFRDDVASIVAASELLVLSSDHEGLPVAVMEALALGVPVVSTAVGGMAEAIAHDREGLLVPPRDPAALAAAVAAVCDDPTLRARLSVAAVQRSDAFDAAVAAERIESIYRQRGGTPAITT